MAKRIIDLTLTTSAYPWPEPEKAPPPYTHHEELTDDRNAFSIYQKLLIHGFGIGSAQRHCMEITCTVDSGTQVEVLWLNEEIMFGSLLPQLKPCVRDMSQIPIRQFVGPASLIDISSFGHGAQIDLETTRKLSQHVEPGDMVLVRTGITDNLYKGKMPYSQEWFPKTPGLSPEAAKWLCEEKEISLYGVDAPTVECGQRVFIEGSGYQPVHKALFYNNAVIIEKLVNLGALKSNRFFCICGAPLKTKGLSGSPVTIIAFEGDFDGGQYEIVNLTHRMLAYPTPPPNRLVQSFSKIEPLDCEEDIYKRFRIMKGTLRGLKRGFAQKMFDWFEWMTFTSKLGTHIEVPYINKNGWNLPENILTCPVDVDPERLCGRAILIDLSTRIGPGQCVNMKDIKSYEHEIQHNDIVLVRTDYTDWYYPLNGWLKMSPGFSPDVIDFLAQKGIKMLVTDTSSIEDPLSTDSLPDPNLHTLFQSSIPVVKNASNLWMLEQNTFFLAALPLPFIGLDASPVRLLAIEKY